MVIALAQGARGERMRLTARCWQVWGWGEGRGEEGKPGWGATAQEPQRPPLAPKSRGPMNNK